MTPERWQQIQDVLEEALQLAPDQRPAFLDQACSSDQSLRQEVETLLGSSSDVRSSFLQPSTLRVTLTPGTKLGEYEVKALLGSGGMGEVYRARDSRLRRDVAIKVLPSLFSADSERLRRFEQEARAAAALNHPNILVVFQMGTYEGAPYLVTELLEGETLREQIKRGRVPVRKAIDYGVQTARGLAAAHEEGIVHRDLKPENLFVTRDGRVKILDYGLAKLTQPSSHLESGSPGLNNSTEPGVVMGTVGYMSPEQVRGQTVDHRADIFAFGAVLYEMLAGKRAFQKPTSMDTMSAILNEDPPGISQVTTGISPAMQRVVHRCLEKVPEQRFQSASDLAFALDALSQHSDSTTPYLILTKDVGKSRLLAVVKQHRLRLAASLVIVALVLGAAFYATRGWRLRNLPHAKITYTQFTFSGDAYYPAISPDGLFVTYVSMKPGEQQKLIVQASNGTQLELARGVWLKYPQWSPDGSEILFLRAEPQAGKSALTADDWVVSVVSRLGGVARSIDKAHYACWCAPDGSLIVTARNSLKSGFKGVRLVNTVTGDAKEVPLSQYTYLGGLDCSARAGLILALTQQSNESQIRIFKPDGSGERKLIGEADLIFAARWSPSGDTIYYLHGKRTIQELSKISVTGRQITPEALADGLQIGGYMTLSADGSRLAYARDDYASNLWRVKLQTGGKTAKPEISQLTSGTSYYGGPSFSPDGRWIAFARGPGADEENIFKIPVAGGDPIQLTFFKHAEADGPVWSPDGERIAFVSDQDGTSRIWTIGANGAGAQALTNTNASDTQDKIAWSPGSDIVYQKPGMENFLRVNQKTHEQNPVIQHDQSVGWLPHKPVLSPDGKKMAVWWSRKEKGLWIISLQPYSETFLLAGGFYPFGWSPDGKNLYAVRFEPGEIGRREIVRVQLAAPNEVTSVAILPGDVADYDGADVSPDGKEIFASVGEEKSDVWIMEAFDSLPR
jgi:serine/threonine protein kinase/Tol biopolymer transport system component